MGGARTRAASVAPPRAMHYTLKRIMLGQDLLPLLRAFALRSRSASVDLRQFLASMPRGQAQVGEVEAVVRKLAAEGALVVSTEEAGRPWVLSLPDYPVFALAEEYKNLTMDASKPFPREGTAPSPIPAAELVTADVKEQLGALMEASAPGMKTVVKLQFPEGVDALLVPQVSVATDLIEAAVAKISRYLQNGKNAAYAESKLGGVLRGNEVLVRQAIEDLATRPKKAASTVLNPTDFTFRFWTHLSNLVLQDIRAKSDKTDQDQGACQSAYILGYAVFHKKGAVQREQEWTNDRKSLEVLVRKAPFVFGFQDLYDLKDDKGTTFVSKHSRDFIHSFLKEKTKPKAEETIPYIVRVHAAAQKKEYFIQRDLVVPVFLKKLAETAEDLRARYLDAWTAELRADRTPEVTKSDAAFRRDVEFQVKEGYPLLAALSNGAILYQAGEETNISDSAKVELRKCFAVENILRPFDELLGLSRLVLLKNARIYLPFWMTVPVLSALLRMFRRMFRGREAQPAEKQQSAPSSAARPAEAETAKVVSAAGGTEKPKVAQGKEALLRYRRSITSLISQYVAHGRTIDDTLEELAEKWNPLYAPEQKRNLVEDVNALVRDFLRPVRKSFLVRPPDLKRIHSLAEQLSTSKSLAKIKKRDLLMRYIELYMIRCLQVKQL
jgi:hypothetical protein